MDIERRLPKMTKDWEFAEGGGHLENPSLVKLNEPHQWRPIKYVSYLWLLVDRGDLRVGIETQAAVRKDSQGFDIGRGTLRQHRRYGHPTLTRPGESYLALAGGELIYKASRGWIINRDSGRYGVGLRSDHDQRQALMLMVRGLFSTLAKLDVWITTDVKVNSLLCPKCGWHAQESQAGAEVVIKCTRMKCGWKQTVPVLRKHEGDLTGSTIDRARRQ